jgi:hypothetical protein
VAVAEAAVVEMLTEALFTEVQLAAVVQVFPVVMLVL